MRVTICTCFGSYAHFVMKRETLNVYIVNKRNILHCTGAGSVCEVLEGLAFVRAPGDGELQGPSAAAAVLPPIPAAVLTGRKYSKGSPLTVFFRPRFKLFAQNRSEGRSVLRWYPPGVKLIVHNSASVPIQLGTQ